MPDSKTVRCTVCDRAYPPYELVNTVRRDLKCRHAEFAKQRQAAAEVYKNRSEQQLKNALIARSVAAQESAVDEPGSYVAVVTPANTRIVTSLPRRRRYRFVNRLSKLIEACEDRGLLTESAVAESMQSAQSARLVEDEHLPVFDSACANCLGNCCLRGGTRAYLDEFVLQQFKAAHPDSNSATLLRTYSSYLPERSFKDSCVFHTESGCGLPRNLRSRTCNRMICGGLVELKLRSNLDDQKKFFLAASDSHGVVRSKFVNSEETAVVSAP